MKKVLLGLMVVAIVSVVHAADPANKIQGNVEITGSLTIGNGIIVATNVTAPTVDGTTVVKSRTYSTMVSDQTDTKIDMVQHGITVATGSCSITNTFSPVFIEQPTLVYQYANNMVAPTNPITVTTNTMVVNMAQTSVVWIAVGRVK